MSKLKSNDYRPKLNNIQHPIITGSYYIPTLEIAELYLEVTKWINGRVTGGIVFGRPRLGKTKAVKYIQTRLSESFDDIETFYCSCNYHRNPSEAKFLSELLEGIGHKVYLSGTIPSKHNRIVRYLIEYAERSSRKSLVLFLDDAQNLTEYHYNWLMDIYNKLDIRGYHMLIILIGQEELLHQRTAFIQAKKQQIIGRFMVQDYKFSGIRNIDELTICLESYDNSSEFPEGSNFSYTRFYFPIGFNNGFRISEQSNMIFNLFLTLREEVGVHSKLEIPMQYLTSVVEYCFRIYGYDGKQLEYLNDDQWREAIEKSGFINSELLNNMI